jgi:hypothetical protein
VATLRTARAQRNSAASAECIASIPNPAKVRATAAEIRRGWSIQERRRRAEIARSMCLAQFVDDLFDAPQPPPLKVRPRSQSWR